MPEVRRRAAIGIFNTAADLDAVTSKLRSQGVDRCVTLDVGSAAVGIQQVGPFPLLSSSLLGDLQARYPDAFMLQVDLTGGAKEEALVARTLLASAAQSVQLHDL